MILYSHTVNMIANDIYTKCRLFRLKELLLGVYITLKIEFYSLFNNI